jgi:hypothetical protein
MSKFLRLRREVGHGGKIPRAWGMAWYEPRRRVGIYYPAPLHWLVRLARGCAYRIRTALRAPGREGTQIFEMQREHQHRLRLSEEYANGYMAGWQECYAVCVEAMQEELTRPGNIWEIGALLVDAPPDAKEN